MKFIIFSKENCPWCNKAKALLDTENWGYYEWNISENEWARDYIKQSGFTTVPQIYFGGKHIGGYEALENFLAIN